MFRLRRWRNVTPLLHADGFHSSRLKAFSVDDDNSRDYLSILERLLFV